MFRLIPLFLVSLGGCATLTNDAHVPIAMSFSSGDSGSCALSNKREAQMATIPSVVSVRRSDDGLKYDCKTGSGKQAIGIIPSTMGGKIIASAVFLDFGITDAITDKHREYPASYVIPVAR